MKHAHAVTCAVGLMLLPSVVAAKVDKRPFTKDFPVEACDFESTGTNPLFPLQPGLVRHYSNAACVADGKCKEPEELVITVTDEIRVLDLELEDEQRTIETRVIEEVTTSDGAPVETSRNYFAACAGSQDVYYFGEDVDIYENGVIVNHDGAWLAGENGAKPGINMPGGAFLIGARYFQEIAPRVALDRAEHIDMDLEIEVPAGEFEDCVKIRETTPLDRKSISDKVYCPGVGLVIDSELDLEGYFE